jgi:hypothetical protein
MSYVPRKLSVRASGDGVQLLHTALLQVGSDIAVGELIDATYGPTTRMAVAAFQREHGLVTNGVLDDITAATIAGAVAGAEKRMHIVGIVRDADGDPVPSVTVSAIDRDLRREQPLGTVSTDGRGHYRISYTAEAFRRADKASADVLVRVSDGNTKLWDPPVSDVLFNAPDLAIVLIDLPASVRKTPSEYERIFNAVTPLLDDVSLDGLREDTEVRDISFLTGETGFSEQSLTNFAVAQRMAAKRQIAAAFFYALFAQGTLLGAGLSSAAGARFAITLDTDLDTLFHDVALLPPDTVTAAVTAAIAARQVPAELADQMRSITAKLAEDRPKAEAYVADERPRVLLGRIESFLAAGAHSTVREILTADAYGDLPSLFGRLQDAGVFRDAGAASAAQTTTILGDLLGHDQQIIDGVARQIGIASPADLPKAAALSPSQWREVLTRNASAPIVGGRAIRPEQIAAHASSLARTLEARYPTVAFVAQLQRDTTAFPGRRDAILSMLTAHADFDLATGNIETRLGTHPAAVSTPAPQRPILPAGGDEKKIRIDASLDRTVVIPTGGAAPAPAPVPPPVATPVARPVATAKDQLKAVQRVFKLAPTYRQTTALLDAGIHSAAAAHAIGQQQFVDTATATGHFTEAEAKVAYAKATDVHLASTMLAGQIAGAGGALGIPALGGGAAPASLAAVTKDFPNMSSLFALTDVCQCDDCRNVHSASAYLADVLQFLKNRLVTGGGGPAVKKAKDVLFARRPDLGDLDLSCENTNTELPYIDLVCELLEDTVAPDAGIAYSGAVTTSANPVATVAPALLTALTGAGWAFTADALVYEPDLAGARVVRDTHAVAKLVPNGAAWKIHPLRQTYGDSPEVMAAPQYVNPNAYATLAAARYAFGLPFDLSHEETRAYFTQFGVDRAALMRALQVGTAPADRDIAAEALGLSDGERALIVTPNAGDQPTIWNIASLSGSGGIAEVDNFLTRSGLDYPDLVALLALPWLNPGNAIFIKHLDSGCDLAQQQLQNLDNAALDRFHRFIRLWRATGWPAATLDRAIRAPKLGNAFLDDALLVTVDRLNQVVALGFTLDEALNLFDPLPTDPGGRYEQVFLTASSVGIVNPAFAVAAVAANELAETTTPGTGVKLSGYTDYVALCLGAKAADIALLVDPSAILSMANLSALYATTRIGRALRVAAADMVAVETLTGIAPLTGPADTLRFAAAVATIGAAAETGTGLRYLLRHEVADLAARELADTVATGLLTSLQQGYQAAYASTRPAIDPAAPPEENLTGLRDLLAKVTGVGEPELGAFVAIIDGAWTDTTRTPAQFVDVTLGGIVDTTAIKAAIVATPTDPQRTAMIEAIATTLSAYFYTSAKAALVTAAITTAFTLAPDVATALLAGARLHEPPAALNRLLGDLLTDDVLIDTVNTPPVPPAITPAAFDLQYRSLRSLATASALLGPLALTGDRVAWLLDHAAALGWLAPDTLAYQTGVTPATYAAWVRLDGAMGLVDAYPPVVNPTDTANPWTVYGFFELVGTPADLNAYLANLTGLDSVALTAIATAYGLSTTDYADPATIDRLIIAAGFLRRLGIDLTTAQTLVQPVLTAAETMVMRQALKARYAEADWWGVLQTVQDALRLRKRDALVAYLLAVNPDLKGTDDLFDYFLIDVEMSPCMPTSRMVQAHATVQLYIQRTLMGLEPDSVAAVDQDSGWSQWEWMANYRVWQANRKIFLYPENWILPELRDDKSEIFAALENTLQQDALTDLAVENAAISYLEQLDDIAHVDVMAAYYQEDRYTMHVFARTKGGDPAVYYYRQFQKERAWTPWTRVPLDIAGDHLLAFDRNSRLTLVWPVFSQEPDPAQRPNIPDPNTFTGGPTDRPNRRWKIQLAVSELGNNGWTAKKVSHDPLYYPASGFIEDLPDVDQFHFFAYAGLGGAGQAISCLQDAEFIGSFALTGCKGYPEPTQGGTGAGMILSPQFNRSVMSAERYAETADTTSDDLSIRNVMSPAGQMITAKTPGQFTVTYPMQLTLIDWLMLMLELLEGSKTHYQAAEYASERRLQIPLGTFMPFFYGDYDRTYVIVPGFYEKREKEPSTTPIEKTFSDIDKFVHDVLALLTKYLLVYEADPAHDLKAALEAMTKDAEYARLVAEFKVYRSLHYGMKFENFYHPLTCFLRITLNQSGIPALMRRETQLKDTGFDFKAVYQPTPIVVDPYPVEDLDFSSSGAYASYNWELFFHLPFDIAMRLSADQQFEAARDWFHYVFNPVGIDSAVAVPGGSPERRYWITKPFFERPVADYLAERIDDIMYAIAADPSGASITDLAFAVSQWRDNPFKPDVIARTRPVAYQMALVVNYIQNLVDWGDNLFRQFTRESITQATQLYILADKLLGPKPREVPPLVEPPIETYNQLEAKLDLFGNALLDLENLIPDLGLLPHDGAELPSPLTLSALYFCIPANDELLAKWDLVADRLLKIRSCQNIDGVETPLALFSPPIDPGALVRAVASGLLLSTILAGLGAPLPNYRFHVLAQKATELTTQVSALGSALLAALEKRDAEAVERLHAGQESVVLDAVRQVKLATIAEAEGAIVQLQKTRATTQARQQYYAGREYMNTWETTAVVASGVSLIGEVAIAAGYILAGGLKLIPEFMIGAAGFGGSPTVNATTGGSSFGGAAETAVQVLSSLTRTADKAGSMASTQGGYRRRMDDWQFQAAQAGAELQSIDAQITNGHLHVDMLHADLAAHDKQIANAKANSAFLHSKYTNQELYDWMVGQISSVYFSSYQLALDAARKAERCFDHELGTDRTFLRPGYWDSLKKGLMTAEALLLDIKRMEMAYLDANKREYELTKNVSLAQLDPAALVMLINTGSCVVSIPEAVFDLDHPGHYLRRLKTVSMSIPCVAGPYTSVSAKLSLIGNRYRKTTAMRQGVSTDYDKYAEQPGDDRFAYNIGSIESIATSTGATDSGMFELSFADERYLPFEGKGAISTWRLEMQRDFAQFDFDTISDVVLHLRYTAREGGSALAGVASKSLKDTLNAMAVDASRTGLSTSFNLRRSFADQWYELQTTHTTSLTITEANLPFLARGHTVTIDSVTWFARVTGNPAGYQIRVDHAPVTLPRNADARLCIGTGGPIALGSSVLVEAATPGLTDLTLLVHYTLGS